jgi:hypothetical protein
MSETPTLGELRADFTERNTALFMFLGLLSGLGGLLRTLEAEAARPAVPPAACEPPAKLDYLVLGLVALHRQVTALAERGRQDAQPPDPPRPPRPPADLLR